MHSFLKTLDEQRWDDHRYYHQSRINQSLHLLSALSFVCAYGLLLVDPALAAQVQLPSVKPVGAVSVTVAPMTPLGPLLVATMV